MEDCSISSPTVDGSTRIALNKLDVNSAIRSILTDSRNEFNQRAGDRLYYVDEDYGNGVDRAILIHTEMESQAVDTRQQVTSSGIYLPWGRKYSLSGITDRVAVN